MENTEEPRLLVLGALFMAAFTVALDSFPAREQGVQGGRWTQAEGRTVSQVTCCVTLAG